MRRVRLAVFMALSILIIARLDAQDSTNLGKAARRGDFTISFTERSPLSAIEGIKGRLGDRVVQIELMEREEVNYDLSKERFSVYVPHDYQPNTPYGLFVWIDPQSSGNIREDYKSFMDKHRLIWIGPGKSGNNRPLWHRLAPAIDAVHNMKKRYTIDPKRVYVGGYVDGTRSASFLAVAYPELFYGGFYLHGGYYFRQLAVPSKPGYYFYRFKAPPERTLQLIMKRNWYVLLSGDHDMFRKTEILVQATYGRYKRDGFKHVTYLQIPGMRRRYPNAEWFGKGIAFLEDPSVEVFEDHFSVTAAIEDNARNETMQPSSEKTTHRESPFAGRTKRPAFTEIERLSGRGPSRSRASKAVQSLRPGFEMTVPTQPTATRSTPLSATEPQRRTAEAKVEWESMEHSDRARHTIEELDLFPGIEVSVEASITKKNFLVYVPLDYTPERPWPVIFCYHGYGGSATTSPFKKVTHGEGFVIVGMNYATKDYHKGLPYDKTGPEKAYFDEAFAFVSSHLNIDPEFVFMGGYSQGGYSTTVLGEQLLDRLAGRLILGAGRTHVDRYPPPAELIRGHPVFFGVGELDDPHYIRAKNAAQRYREWEADVTFEGWPGETHGLSQNWHTKTEMVDWLIANGPLKQIESRFKQAHMAEGAGKLGEAFTLYNQVSGILPGDELCVEAAASAEKLFQQANAQLAEAERAVTRKPYPQAVKRLKQVVKTYAGSVFADRAQQHLKDLLNAKADELEVRARAAEDARDYTKALQLYQLYLTHFFEADRYQVVKAHVKTLKVTSKAQDTN